MDKMFPIFRILIRYIDVKTYYSLRGVCKQWRWYFTLVDIEFRSHIINSFVQTLYTLYGKSTTDILRFRGHHLALRDLISKWMYYSTRDKKLTQISKDVVQFYKESECIKAFTVIHIKRCGVAVEVYFRVRVMKHKRHKKNLRLKFEPCLIMNGETKWYYDCIGDVCKRLENLGISISKKEYNLHRIKISFDDKKFRLSSVVPLCLRVPKDKLNEYEILE